MRHSGVSVIVALILICIGGYGLSRVPTGFIPIEDQGYLLAAVQLPDGASLDRTQRVMDQVQEIASKTPGVDQVMTIAGISALDSSSSLANAGVAYLVLTEWSKRGPGEDLLSLFNELNQKLSVDRGGADPGGPAAADPGHRQRRRLCHADRTARRQFRLRQAAGHHQCHGGERAVAKRAAAVSARRSARRCRSSTSRSTAIKTQTLHVTTDQVFQTLSSYMGASFVNQFNKFGRTFQVYTQADAQVPPDHARHREHDGAQLATAT